MTIHDKLAARIRAVADERKACQAFEDKYAGTWLDDVARALLEGDLDDVLGVREPTIEDVKREAVRVFGKHTAARTWEDGLSIQVGTVILNELFYEPTIAAVYAALRALPDYEGPR